jgi:hypothetical protein
MNDIADLIVKKARSTPEDTAVGLQCNNVTITKVLVTGGFGLQIKSQGSHFLFPISEAKGAATCFLTAGRCAGVDANAWFHPTVLHANGIPLLKFEWNDNKERKAAIQSLAHLLLNPPLSDIEMETASFDARGHAGWSVDAPMRSESSDVESDDD